MKKTPRRGQASTSQRQWSRRAYVKEEDEGAGKLRAFINESSARASGRRTLSRCANDPDLPRYPVGQARKDMSFSQFSVDPFLEEVTLVVIFPDSGEVAIVSNFDSKGRIYQGGEPIPQLRNKDGTEDTAVLLGWGETEADAITTAREYIKRVAKWHGHEEGEVELNLFGHDLAQSEMFKDLTQ